MLLCHPPNKKQICDVMWRYTTKSHNQKIWSLNCENERILPLVFLLYVFVANISSPYEWLFFRLMQKEAVYGLTEISRREIQSARLVANPGCYPTSVQLPLIPLIKVCSRKKKEHIFNCMHCEFVKISWKWKDLSRGLLCWKIWILNESSLLKL